MKTIFLVSNLLFILFIAAPSQARQYNDAGIDPQEFQNIKTAVENQGLSIANYQNQFSEITQKLQTMSGDVGRNYKSNKDQEKMIQDLQARMQTIEDKMTSLTSQLLELQSEGFMSPQASKRTDEYKTYVRGLEYVNAQDYAKVIKAMKDFQTKNPKSIYLSFAQFWIGESYYMQNDFPMAIKSFQTLLNKNPKSAKAPTALYRQGLAFAQLKAMDDAKTFFQKVVRTYPQSIEAVQASAQMKRINDAQELERQKNLEINFVQ